MGKKIWIIIIIVITSITIIKMQGRTDSQMQRLRIGEATIKYETAKTPAEIERGLSYRKDVPQGFGMLFVFPEKGFRSFWMHEMLFPLDIIWIADNKIVQIDKNVPIKTNGAWTIVNPNYPVDMVLEMKGGEAERLGFSNGKNVFIPD